MINIGYGNMVSSSKILAILIADSAPVKRLVQQAKENETCIDSTCGRKVRSVIIMNSHTILSSVHPETLCERIHSSQKDS